MVSNDTPRGAAIFGRVSKLRVGILFGGVSTEHEVSLASATTVLQALDPARYTPVLIGLDHDGSWRVSEADLLPEDVFTSADASRAFPTLRDGLRFADSGGASLLDSLDVVFPIVHGRGGEDGSLQGLLELVELPYVGPGVLSTALCMDKALSKRALRDAGIPVLPYLEASRHSVLQDDAALIDAAEQEFGFPVFVKPTNTGSSVGVHKARSRLELHQGIKEAGRYDLDVIVEPGADVREIECAVLGGHDPRSSVPGEIVSPNEFYDYEAKYVSDDTQLLVPAPVSESLAEDLQEMAVAAFRALKCWGLARVDFFVVEGDGSNPRVLVNELNTLPGFTEGSMYPRLWQESGIALPELVDRLIELALERRAEQRSLETRFQS